MTAIAILDHRSVIAVTGADRVSFLQGLVSQDVAKAAPGRALWSALLTPQGKWLAEFFIFSDRERLLLDVEAALRDDLIRRLSRYRLRAQVALAPSAEVVLAAWNGPAPVCAEALVAADPRLPEAGFRILATTPPAVCATAADWDAHRLALGLPEGTRDLEREKSILLEAGFDELGGIAWDKGCYMGQELTARTRYRGLVKRRLVPVHLLDGALPVPGTSLLDAEGRERGVMRSGQGAIGLALLRLEALRSGEDLQGDGGRLRPAPPPWMRLPPEAG